MSRKTKSMRGEIVDFDLMEIKRNLKKHPAPISVQQRQDFVDKKIKRRVKKLADKITEKQLEDAASVQTTNSVQNVGDEPILEKTVVQPRNALKELPVEEKEVIKPKRKRRTIKKK